MIYNYWWDSISKKKIKCRVEVVRCLVNINVKNYKMSDDHVRFTLETKWENFI